MNWTSDDLKAAVAKLDSKLTRDEKVAALNTQVEQLTSQPFPWSDAKALARGSSTMDWSRIIARSRMTPALPPVTPADFAVLVAINATESSDGQMIDPSNERGWQTFQAGIGVLSAVGDLSADTVTLITGLGAKTVPQWNPPITDRDVWIVEGQPP